MRIIPVLDLKNGVVVHASGGDRTAYQPVRSRLCPSPEPADVFRALSAVVGHRTVYVADLDALAGRAGHEAVVADLVRWHGADVWLDAGVRDPKSAARWLELGVGRVVVGTETLTGFGDLERIAGAGLQDRVIVSVDMRDGRLLARGQEIQSADPLTVVRNGLELGLHQYLLLTLNRVGSLAGPDWELVQRVTRAVPKVEVYCGGGIRGPQDLQQLEAAGAAGALVATALHQGSLSKFEWEA